MRQIATLPSSQAELLADHLLTLRIETRLEPDGNGTALWVCDEDKVPQARRELEQFSAHPTDGRYASARHQAAALRAQAETLEEDYQERTERLRDRMEAGDGADRRPVTVALLMLSVLVYVSAAPGDWRAYGYDPGKVYDALSINSRETAHQGWLADVRAGQAWRLFTPALLHFGVDHLLMNCLAVLWMASAVEARRGSWRLLALVLVLAVASHVPQYFLGGRWLRINDELVLIPSVGFGGLSGVAYGLFGWLWMKSRHEPELGLDMPPGTVGVFMVWFFICWSGAVGNVANVAHTAGLLAGLGLGRLPTIRWGGSPPEEEGPP
ncbi:MAG: rhomboid family intramembrane serine protease [Gemmataceae bacterium]|nr:rhomboid family intramembrane serine protease [Gemmataceae bacterium]